MDVGSVSTAMSMDQVMNEVAFAIMDKSLETVQTVGDSMIKMLEASVNPNLGQNIDYSV